MDNCPEEGLRTNYQKHQAISTAICEGAKPKHEWARNQGDHPVLSPSETWADISEEGNPRTGASTVSTAQCFLSKGVNEIVLTDVLNGTLKT